MIDNIEKQGITLFWASTSQWQTLTGAWTTYEPYIYTKVDNIEKT